jgi:hypothetical protein
MPKTLCLALVPILTALATGQTHQHGSAPSGDGNFNPFIFANPRGGFLLAYVEKANDAANVMLKRSPDGTQFSTPVRVNDRPGDGAVRNENPPKIAVGPAGEVYVCWANERERWKGDIRFARSTDNGFTFSPAISLNSDAGGKATGHAFQSVAVDRTGRVYVAWIDERNKKAGDRGAEIWMAISDDRGKTFSKDRRILSDVCECCRTNIQFGADGTLLIAYRNVPITGPMHRDIFLARSTDRGVTFSASPVSGDGWEINACPVTGPALCVGDDGRVLIVWFTGGGPRPGLYFTSSGDSGRSFSPRKLLDENQRLGKHAQAVSSAAGQILVAWDDFGEGVKGIAGTLDVKGSVFARLLSEPNLSYPTLAANSNVAIVAGMNQSSRDIKLVSYRLAQAP